MIVRSSSVERVDAHRHELCGSLLLEPVSEALVVRVLAGENCACNAIHVSPPRRADRARCDRTAACRTEPGVLNPAVSSNFVDHEVVRLADIRGREEREPKVAGQM